MRCSESNRATETGLKGICMDIHPALNSSWSEDSQLGPAGGMTTDRSENLSTRSHVNIYYGRPGLTSSLSHVNGALHSNVRTRPDFTFSIQNLKPGLQFVVKSLSEQSNKQIIVKFMRLELSASKCLN